MSFKDGKLNRRDLLKHIGAGALLTSPVLSAPERAEAFFNALMIKKKTAALPVPSSSMFSATIYTGNSGTQSITTLANMDTDGGLLWIKRRDAAVSNVLFDTVRGSANMLATDTTAASVGAQPISITSTGFTLTATAASAYNAPNSYVAWCFKRTAKFFDLSTVTKTAGSNATVDFPALVDLGMVLVKRTDNTGNWYVWHRGVDAGKLYTFADGTETAMTHFSVSGTTVTLTNGVITDGTYVVYAWAHDSSPSGNIYFGALANGHSPATITLGWEPQALYYKANTMNYWNFFDTTRGDTGASQKVISINLSNAEATYSNQPFPIATGISWPGGVGGVKLLYMAIRKP